MTTPADQLQDREIRQATDPPTLWLSLALGSILIHLVLFILASLVATRTATVQLETEPIAVEFVDPNAAVEQAVPSEAIAARPGRTSSNTPSSTQAQSGTARSQPLDFNQPVEQPSTPPQTPRRNPVPVQPQPPQPTPPNVPAQPQPDLPVNPQPPQPNASTQPQGQSGSGTNLPGNLAPETTGTQEPARGDRITLPPQGGNVAVTVSNPSQPVDPQRQPPRPIEQQKNLLIQYPRELAKQTIVLQASLYIDKNGSLLEVIETKQLSPGSAINPDILKSIAEQIFTQWRFEPAQDAQDGKPLTPQESNLIINAQVQLP